MTTFASTKVTENQTISQWMLKYNDLLDHLDTIISEVPVNITLSDVDNWRLAYNSKINSASFDTNNGTLTIVTQDGTNREVDLDGRYIQSVNLDWDAANGILSTGLGTPVDLDGRYLQSFTESDPTVPVHVKNISQNNIINWNSAHSISTKYSYINSNSPINNGEWLLIDTSLGPITITMPISSSNGDIIRITDFNGAWDTNNVILTGGTFLAVDGTTISEDFILDISHFDVTAVFFNGAWRIR